LLSTPLTTWGSLVPLKLVNLLMSLLRVEACSYRMENCLLALINANILDNSDGSTLP
jgi:hypothetical protein